jgi:hypothetical protein
VTAVGYPFSLLQGLSDFWTRFFADADQLDALYHGTAIQLGQAYLDLMSATLGVALRDAVALDKEYWRLFAVREDEVRFVAGATTDDDRWAITLPDPVVSFASFDNKVVEPTVSLEPRLDFDFVESEVRFRQDPTDPLGTGVPLNGYARRALDVAVGGRLTNTTVTDWTTSPVKKGDTIRLLDVGTDGTQRLRSDHEVALVRPTGLLAAASTPLPDPATGVKFVVLRVPSNAKVFAESFTLSGGTGTLAHTRLDHGSVRVFAKGPLGADVVEGVDYEVNYEHGKIYALTTWQSLPGPYGVDYTWQMEVYPTSGVSPRLSSTGVISAATTARVTQVAGWTTSVLVDRRTLANNFGALIGRQAPSSEAYRAFLMGIFQLYVLGPVLERIESALNVVLNLPVVRDDGEVYVSTDTTDPLVDRVLTTRPSTGQTATYEFPKGTPLRALTVGQALLSFEPLTTAVTVTDWVQSPNWWYNETIPKELFGNPPTVNRRTARPYYVRNVIGASDDPQIGDPGLLIGADENGFIPTSPHPVFRHRMAFVMMDRYLKYHTFSVKFDATALSATTGSAFAQSIVDLNELVLSAKPSHTYVFTTPSTFFRDEVSVTEDAISFDRQVGSRVFGPDKVVFTDGPLTIGTNGWRIGDYFYYDFIMDVVAFPAPGVPVVMPDAPAPPRRRRLVIVFVDGDIGGRRLVENVDYSVDYANCTITRLTAWTSTTVIVTFRPLHIGNVVDAPASNFDMTLYLDEIDPATVTAAFDPAAAGWDGVATPPTAPRDIGMVERAIVVSAHP